MMVSRDVKNDKSIRLLVKLQNSSSDTLIWISTNDTQALNIVLVNSKGKAVPTTPAGDRTVNGLPLHRKKEQLKPGDIHNWNIPLSSLFELTPGVYKISVTLYFESDLIKQLEIKEYQFAINASGDIE